MTDTRERRIWAEITELTAAEQERLLTRLAALVRGHGKADRV